MIEIKNVSFSYGKNSVISSLYMRLDLNKIYCVMGPSGVGKTTLLGIISGLLKLESGEISGISGMKKSFVFQENRLVPNLSVRENIEYVTDDADSVTRALSDVGLKDFSDLSPDELSGGMARRAAIARAIAFGGDIFFIDEPLYGLDVKTGGEILSLLKESLRGKTALIVTHSPDEAFFLADEIIVLPSAPVSEARIFPKAKFKTSEEIKSYLSI